MKIAGVDVIATAKGTFKQFREHDLQGSAAQVTYSILFSVVPLLIFLTALSGFVARAFGVDDSMNRITSWLFDHMGTTQANAVREPIETVVKQNNGGLLSIGAVLALWGGKNAVAALMKALNVAFDVEEGRSFIARNLVAIGLTIALGVALTLASAIFLIGANFAGSALERIGLGETWVTVWSYLRWPVIAAILIAVLCTLYWRAPNRKMPYTRLVPGAILTLIGWGIITLGIGFYFANFAGYAGGTYGALGGVLVFLFWVNLMVTILLLGAELNSVLLVKRGAPVIAHSPSTTPTVAVAPEPTQTVSDVPRGTFQPGITAKSKSSKKQTTWIVTLTKIVAKAVLTIRRLTKRFSSSDRR